jgi:hypothetical protein
MAISKATSAPSFSCLALLPMARVHERGRPVWGPSFGLHAQASRRRCLQALWPLLDRYRIYASSAYGKCITVSLGSRHSALIWVCSPMNELQPWLLGVRVLANIWPRLCRCPAVPICPTSASSVFLILIMKPSYHPHSSYSLTPAAPS